MKKFRLMTVLLMLAGYSYAQKPISLNAVLDSAKNRNPELMVSKSQYQQSKASPAPVEGIGATSLSLTYGQIDGPIDEDYQFQIQQPLGNPVKGMYERRKKQSQVELSSLEIELQEAYLLMVVSRAYAQWSFCRQEVALRHIQLQYYDSAAAASQQLYNAGELSNVEFGLSQSRLLTAREIYFSAFKEQTIARQTIESLCMMPLGGFFPADSLSRRFVGGSIQPVAGNLQQQRLAASQKIAEQQLAATTAALAPSFSVGYFNQQLNGISGYQGVMAGIDIPLLKPGSHKQRQVARLELEQAKIGAESRQYQIATQLEMLQQQRQLITDQLLSSPINTANLKQGMASALLLFKTGEIDFITLSQMIDGLVDGYVRQQNLYYQYYSINAEIQYLSK